MDNEYNKGIQIGELVGEVKSFTKMLESYIEKQDKWNSIMDKRVTITETWIQTTTGKVVVLTTVFGIVGSLCYIGINWLINHWK